MKRVAAILRHWVLREMIGVLILLGAILYVPVLVSGWLAVDEMPFSRREPQDVVKLFPARGEARAALVSVVEGLLAALRQQDFEGARQWTSRTLRRHLPATDFERMVAQEAPVMAEDHTAEIGGVWVSRNREAAVVDVRLHSVASRLACYRCLLQANLDRWFVMDVRPLPLEEYERLLSGEW